MSANKVTTKTKNSLKDSIEKPLGIKTMICVDVANIRSNGGENMQYNILKDFAQRDGSFVNSMNAYVVNDPNEETAKCTYCKNTTKFYNKTNKPICKSCSEKHENNNNVNEHINVFHNMISNMGYKLHFAKTKVFEQPNGRKKTIKQNCDQMITVDMMTALNNIDKYVLVTADGDFDYVINYLTSIGKQVEVIAFNNVSKDLKTSCNSYFSGYLIPNLLKKGKGYNNDTQKWGEEGSIVRGYCHKTWKNDDFSFMYFYKQIDGSMWRVSANDDQQCLESAFAHNNDLAGEIIVEANKNNDIYEFELALNPNKGNTTKQTTTFVAKNIKRIPQAFV